MNCQAAIYNYTNNAADRVYRPCGGEMAPLATRGGVAREHLVWPTEGTEEPGNRYPTRYVEHFCFSCGSTRFVEIKDPDTTDGE